MVGVAVSEIVYEVLTEFVFDVRGAINNSSLLTGAVDKISSAADGAMFSLNKLGSYLSSGMGLNLSVMGVLGAAIASSEKYLKSAYAFSNILGGNLGSLTGDVHTFNDRLAISDKILKNIAKTSREFSLDEGAMLGTTKMLAAALVPKGLAGKNLGGAVDMARMFEKSAPILGVDTQLAQGQLIRALEGGAGGDDTLFRRLYSDAPEAFQANGIKKGAKTTDATKAFNLLPAEKRFDTLSRAMKKFSSDADVVQGMANLLASRLNMVKNQLIGIDGILRPLGETLSGPIRQGFVILSDYIEKYGRPAIIKLSAAIKNLMEDPARLYATVRQLQQLRSDLPHAIHMTKLWGEFLFAMWVMKFPLVRSVLMAAGTALLRFTGLAGALARFAGFEFGGLFTLSGALGALKVSGASAMFMLRGMVFIFARFIAPLAIALGLLQIFSRAKGYAEAMDAKAIFDQKDKIGSAMGELASHLKRIVAPLEMVFDDVARMIAPLFSWSFYLGMAADSLDTIVAVSDFVSAGFVSLIAVLTGIAVVGRAVLGDFFEVVKVTFINIFEMIFLWSGAIVHRIGEIFDAAKSGNFSQAAGLATAPIQFADLTKPDIMSVSELGALYSATTDAVIDRNIDAINNPNATNKNVSNHVTNIGSVNIRQDFKENQEPDRIAHSFVKTLRDVAINPTQASGRSFAGGLTR